jgi:hypothetical protein
MQKIFPAVTFICFALTVLPFVDLAGFMPDFAFLTAFPFSVIGAVTYVISLIKLRDDHEHTALKVWLTFCFLVFILSLLFFTFYFILFMPGRESAFLIAFLFSVFAVTWLIGMVKLRNDHEHAALKIWLTFCVLAFAFSLLLLIFLIVIVHSVPVIGL